MISNKEVSLITSLSQKKYRNKHQLFVAEGDKLVKDLLNSSFEVYKIFTTNREKHLDIEQATFDITIKEYKKISHLKTPSSIIGVFKIPKNKQLTNKGLILVLDGVQDPGNLGTIIRLCDWYGVDQLVCSKDTVDCYNPKVVQATMGSLSRLPIIYTDITSYLNESKVTKYMSLLEGENIYKHSFPKDAIIVMGNEGNGIRSQIQALGDIKLNIPKFGKNTNVESLNVAMATAIFLSEFRRA